jgi:fumarylacetoacetate (FAA) hydrolase
MKLATRANGHPDGELLIVSDDLRHCVRARGAATLQQALDHWQEVEPLLEDQAAALNAGNESRTEAVDYLTLMAAMPRSFQFLDASAFLAHNHILAQAWGFSPRTENDPPLMYQGLSDRFLPAHGEVSFRSAADDIDLEAEFAIVTDFVPLGTSRQQAAAHIKLIMLLNDWSLRAFGPAEMKGGFGFIHAKPHSSLSAFATTPAGLGESWRNARVCLTTRIVINAAELGHPHGQEMSYGFDELVAHAAATRDLCAGTVIGSGTVSSANYRQVGSGCIAERRAIDSMEKRSLTPYLQFGDRVRIDALDANGRSVFGSIDQVVMPKATQL